MTEINIFLASLDIASDKSRLVNHHSGVPYRAEKPGLATIQAAIYKASLREGGSCFFLRVSDQP